MKTGRRVLVSTDIAIPPAYWNMKTEWVSPNLPKNYGEVENISELLTKKLRHAEDLVKLALQNKDICPLSFLKEKFNSKNDGVVSPKSILPTKNMDVFFHIEDYKDSKRKKVKQCSINVINEMKVHLEHFQKYRKKPITFESFDYQFYNDFINYLTHEISQQRRKQVIKGLKINTVGKTIKHLKAFLNDRAKRKIITPIDLSDFKTLEEEVDAVYLNIKEISKIYHLNLSDQRYLEVYRDLLVLGCLTGFRFSDYSEIRPEEIRDGMLYIKQRKTGSTVVVPLRKEVKRILVDKYNMRIPKISNPHFNEYIKEVCRLAEIDENIKISHRRGNRRVDEIKPKYAWVTSHTCRRSFCTNEYLAETPTELIMAISGHKTEKSFRRYIKPKQFRRHI